METSIANFKSHLSEILNRVEQGERCIVLKQNRPIAAVTPIKKKRKNQTKIGCAKGTAQTLGDLTEPLIPIEYWEMLK